MLSGTPIQNNMMELWSLVNWVSAGKMFGTKSEFSAFFVQPILAGREPKVSYLVIEIYIS